MSTVSGVVIKCASISVTRNQQIVYNSSNIPQGIIYLGLLAAV